MPARLPSLSSADSQYTPCTGPAASQSLRRLLSALASGASLIHRTSTPLIVSSRCASACATPPLSGMITTRFPRAKVTPVGLQTVSGGRKLGTGTRRGTRLAASKLATGGGSEEHTSETQP